MLDVCRTARPARRRRGERQRAARDGHYPEPGRNAQRRGGKLTTYRRIALAALERLQPELGLHRLDRRPWPLPGALGYETVHFPVDVDLETRAHLVHLYGSLAADVLEPAREDPALLERLHPAGPDIAAQARYAMTHEWARTVDDVLRRRTTCFYRGLTDDATRSVVERALDGRLVA